MKVPLTFEFNKDTDICICPSPKGRAGIYLGKTAIYYKSSRGNVVVFPFEIPFANPKRGISCSASLSPVLPDFVKNYIREHFLGEKVSTNDSVLNE